MQFFLPSATSQVQAERVYARIANRLKQIGYEFTLHRIANVSYQQKGNLRCDQVGEPADNGEVILAIFKNEIGYFVCTYSQGAVWGNPKTIRYAVVEAAEAFDPTEFKQKAPE